MATPSLIDRARVAYRAFFNPTWEYLMSDVGHTSSAGISVSEQSALRYSPVWAGVSILSRDVAKLPLVFYKVLPTGGKERFTSDPRYRVLHDEANPEMSAFKFRETMQALTLLWGNAYAEIVRDDLGKARGMYPIAPYRVSVLRDERSGQLAYRVQNPSGRQSVVPPRNMIHLSGLSLDGIIGEAITHYAAESIGLGLASEQFGATFFGNGATFGGVVEYAMPLKDEKKQQIRESIEAVHAGVQRAHKILVLGGAKFTERGTKPHDAQFVEVRKFQVTEVARWLTMPPHKLGDLENAHFTNIEEENLDYYQNTIGGWLALWEQELRRKLISPLEHSQQTIEHVMQGVMRGNSAQRAEFYGKMFNLGAFSTNDILKLENMNPIGPSGDVHLVPLNMIPLERYDEYITLTLEAKKAPPQIPPTAEKSEEKDEQKEAEEDRALAVLREQIAASTERAERHAALAATWEAAATESKEAAALLTDRIATERHAAETARTDAAVKQAALERFEADLASEREIRSTVEAVSRAQAAALTEVSSARDERDAEVKELAAQLVVREEDLKACTVELQAGEAKLTEATQALARETARAGSADVERAAALAEVEHATATLATREAAVIEAQLALADVRASAAAVEARAAEESARAEAAEVARVAAQADVEHAQAALAHRDGALTQTQRELAEVRATQSELEARVLADRQWRASMVMAIRDAMVDAYGRVVRTEVERARKRSANPQGLRRWCEAFYDDHGRDAIADILRPVVKAHLAWSRSEDDPRTIARSLADTYCDHSLKQLTSLADGMDGEEFQSTLQRMLTAWEQERPQLVAEKVLINALESLTA